MRDRAANNLDNLNLVSGLALAWAVKRLVLTRFFENRFCSASVLSIPIGMTDGRRGSPRSSAPPVTKQHTPDPERVVDSATLSGSDIRGDQIPVVFAVAQTTGYHP